MFVDSKGNHWYKGNLHTHTTRSDGRRQPQEVINCYRSAGYDFLALTDHWIVSQAEEQQDFLLISGCEYDIGSCVQEEIYHILALGMREDPCLERGALGVQGVIDTVHGHGGLAVLAHPAWSLNRPEHVKALTGLDGTEIYNTVSGFPWNCRAYSGGFIDQMAAEGALLPCLAGDDAHFYQGEETRSFIYVKSEALTEKAILAALRRGDFYATQGPRFELTRAGDRLLVASTPVQRVAFFTDTVYVPDRTAEGDGITRAEYRIKAGDTFVRVELFDRDGRMAWSSPLKLHD